MKKGKKLRGKRAGSEGIPSSSPQAKKKSCAC
jgi:hypothetical protein